MLRKKRNYAQEIALPSHPSTHMSLTRVCQQSHERISPQHALEATTTTQSRRACTRTPTHNHKQSTSMKTSRMNEQYRTYGQYRTDLTALRTAVAPTRWFHRENHPIEHLQTSTKTTCNQVKTEYRTPHTKEVQYRKQTRTPRLHQQPLRTQDWKGLVVVC
jgi:hypothetical protein